MEESKLNRLRKELKLKEFQFNSIFEFSESIFSSFQVDSIIRIYFSTLMAQLGITRIFLFNTSHSLFKKRGFKISDDELKIIRKGFKNIDTSEWLHLNVDHLEPEHEELKELLISKKIQYLVNVSDSEKRRNILGLGARFNQKELTTENMEYAFFVSRFSLSSIENAFLINKLIETKRLEHEMNIARDIQLSLLPQSIPEMENFEVSVIYQPINDVGGDYYDILKEHKGQQPVLIADVEGKGLSAALLAASSQAIFHSLNELYFFEPGKFVSKANSMIHEFTRGSRFITVFWMLLNNAQKTVTYVNAGHASPFLIHADGSCRRLTTGGFLTGFVEEADYEKEELQLQSGDIIVAFTDGVPEVENASGEEFGEEAVCDFVKENKHLCAQEITDNLFKTINDFSQKTKFRDDFTLIILKVK